MDIKYQQFKTLRELLQPTLKLCKWRRDSIKRQLEHGSYMGEVLIWGLCLVCVGVVMVLMVVNS